MILDFIKLFRVRTAGELVGLLGVIALFYGLFVWHIVLGFICLGLFMIIFASVNSDETVRKGITDTMVEEILMAAKPHLMCKDEEWHDCTFDDAVYAGLEAVKAKKEKKS